MNLNENGSFHSATLSTGPSPAPTDPVHRLTFGPLAHDFPNSTTWPEGWAGQCTSCKDCSNSLALSACLDRFYTRSVGLTGEQSGEC